MKNNMEMIYDLYSLRIFLAGMLKKISRNLAYSEGNQILYEDINHLENLSFFQRLPKDTSKIEEVFSVYIKLFAFVLLEYLSPQNLSLPKNESKPQHFYILKIIQLLRDFNSISHMIYIERNADIEFLIEISPEYIQKELMVIQKSVNSNIETYQLIGVGHDAYLLSKLVKALGDMAVLVDGEGTDYSYYVTVYQFSVSDLDIFGSLKFELRITVENSIASMRILIDSSSDCIKKAHQLQLQTEELAGMIGVTFPNWIKSKDSDSAVYSQCKVFVDTAFGLITPFEECRKSENLGNETALKKDILDSKYVNTSKGHTSGVLNNSLEDYVWTNETNTQLIGNLKGFSRFMPKTVTVASFLGNLVKWFKKSFQLNKKPKYKSGLATVAFLAMLGFVALFSNQVLDAQAPAPSDPVVGVSTNVTPIVQMAALTSHWVVPGNKVDPNAMTNRCSVPKQSDFKRASVGNTQRFGVDLSRYNLPPYDVDQIKSGVFIRVTQYCPISNNESRIANAARTLLVLKRSGEQVGINVIRKNSIELIIGPFESISLAEWTKISIDRELRVNSYIHKSGY